MLDILASSYMSATRMEHLLDTDFMHRDPETVRRLRRIHGLETPYPSLSRQLRGRIGMEGSIERARRPFGPRLIRAARVGLAAIGLGLRRFGAQLERFGEPALPASCTAKPT